MKHLHQRTGLTFDVGSIKDADGEHTYDMTVIMYFGENSNPPIIIGYYFGDYVEAYTDTYINNWLTNNDAETRVLEECHKLIHDHMMINRDYMETLDVCRMDELEYQLEVMLYDHQDQRLLQEKTDRHQYMLYVRNLYTDGKIDAETRESLMRLACNFEEE
jgi:hypothetical protein